MPMGMVARWTEKSIIGCGAQHIGQVGLKLSKRRSAEVAAVWLPLRFVNWHYYDKNVAKG